MHHRRRYGWLLLALLLPALAWGQGQSGPPPTGDIRITQAVFAALETCRPYTTYQITDAQSGTQVEYWCPPTGLPPLEAKSGNNSAPATTAFGATSDRMVWLAPETVSVSSNFTVEGAINFDVDTTGGGITAQLLTLAASLGGEFHLRIVAGTAPLTLAPAAGETINGLSAPVHVSGVRSGMHISRRAGDWEVAFDEPLAVGLLESGTWGSLPYIGNGPVLEPLVCAANDFPLFGGANANPTCKAWGDIPASAGYAPTADGKIGYNTTTHRLVSGKNGAATVIVGGTFAGCAIRNGSTNDSGSGSGSDHDHTLTCTIPANTLHVGDIIESCVGYGMTTGSSVGTLTHKLKLGAATAGQVGAITPPTSVTSQRTFTMCWHTFLVADPGDVVAADTSLLSVPTTATGSTGSNVTGQTVNIDTNSALTVTFSTAWSAAGSSDNDMVQRFIRVGVR